jgi:hypothetical protein
MVCKMLTCIMSLAVIRMSFIAAFFAQLVQTTVSAMRSQWKQHYYAQLTCKSTHVILAGFVQNKHWIFSLFDGACLNSEALCAESCFVEACTGSFTSKWLWMETLVWGWSVCCKCCVFCSFNMALLWLLAVVGAGGSRLPGAAPGSLYCWVYVLAVESSCCC